MVKMQNENCNMRYQKQWDDSYLGYKEMPVLSIKFQN